MERIEGDNKIAYKKIGGGALHWGKQLIKSGQIIRLDPNTIPDNFKDVLIPMEHIREKSAPPIDVVKTEYVLKPRGKSKTLFDVVTKVGVDENGKDIFKAINEKVLSKEVAENLIADLKK
jgi:hypothetical protein